MLRAIKKVSLKKKIVFLVVLLSDHVPYVWPYLFNAFMHDLFNQKYLQKYCKNSLPSNVLSMHPTYYALMSYVVVFSCFQSFVSLHMPFIVNHMFPDEPSQHFANDRTSNLSYWNESTHVPGIKSPFPLFTAKSLSLLFHKSLPSLFMNF